LNRKDASRRPGLSGAQCVAEFYRVLGGDVTDPDEDRVSLRDGDTVLLSFIPDRRLKVFAAAVRTCRARGA
jgi:hypothetical protein